MLLAEALVAVALSRAWRVSWWEWHLLMAVAFATILLAARREYREERSFVQAFGGLYLERTLERVDRRGIAGAHDARDRRRRGPARRRDRTSSAMRGSPPTRSRC